MEKGTVINRLCYKCGTTYTYTVGEKNEHYWRLCKDCHNDRSKPWTCPCGAQFKSRDDLMKHRNNVKANGGWCGVFYNTMDFVCPLCGKIISKAHEKNRPSECIRNHRCPGFKEYEQYGISMNSIDRIIKKLKSIDSKEYYEIPSDNALQTIWLQDRLANITDKYKIRSIESTNRFIILSVPEIKIFFIFDISSMLDSEKWEKVLHIIGWEGVAISWTDCILGRNNCEANVEGILEERINIMSEAKQ